MYPSAPRPRGRPRKRLTRMDAAVDAMRSYGFADGLIVSTVRGLLEAYGVEGWPFIEESSYKVLLEAILEEVEKDEQEKEKSNALQEKERSGNDTKIPAGNNTETAAIGTPNGASILTCYSTEVVPPASQTSGVLHTTSQAAILDIALLEGNACSSAPKGGSSWKNINLDQNCMKKQIIDNDRIVNLGGVQLPGNTSLPTQPTHCVPPHRRRPCYGWISSNDEEDDLIELTPAPLSAGLAKLLSGTDMPRRCRRRWDARPEDM